MESKATCFTNTLNGNDIFTISLDMYSLGVFVEDLAVELLDSVVFGTQKVSEEKFEYM